MQNQAIHCDEGLETVVIELHIYNYISGPKLSPESTSYNLPLDTKPPLHRHFTSNWVHTLGSCTDHLCIADAYDSYRYYNNYQT